MFRTALSGKTARPQPPTVSRRFIPVMHSESLGDVLSRCLEPLEQPVAAASRAELAAGFAAALQRLEAAGDDADARRAESLLSALGAAAVEQWELALAFVAASMRAVPDRRSVRASVPLATLRSRFAAVLRRH
jgi:hypothetical protein